MESKKQILIFKLLKENKINEEEAFVLLQKEYVYIPSYINSPSNPPMNFCYYTGSVSSGGSSSVKTSSCCNSDCNC